MKPPPWRTLDAIDVSDLFDVWLPRTVKAIERGAEALVTIAAELQTAREERTRDALRPHRNR